MYVCATYYAGHIQERPKCIDDGTSVMGAAL